MFYLIKADEIRDSIFQLASYPILWLDTEVADWWTAHSKLSLIQALANPEDLTGSSTYILDVLNRPDLVKCFVEKIIANPKIEKVFHNAGFDLKFLGKHQAKNVACTLVMAKKIPLNTLGTSDRKLKTLAVELCHFSEVDQDQQNSDWGRRPLSARQLHYAKMDTVYVAQVHHHLLKLINSDNSKPVDKPANSENTPFSVTNVRVAFECARLFYLSKHFDGLTLFCPNGNTAGIGNAFHNLSEQFVKLALVDPQMQALFRPKPDQLEAGGIADKIQAIFYNSVFFPYLQSAIQKDARKSQALLSLWEGLKGLIQRWAQLLVSNRRYCNAEEVFSKTFLAQELGIKHDFTLPDGARQLVRGRFDSLVYDFERQRLIVVEYKTYQSPDKSAQIAQVALYGYMLRKKIGVPINSAIYSVLPDWQESIFTWKQLEKTVHQMVPHKLQQMRQWLMWSQGQPNPPPPATQPQLCEICPQRTKCQTFFEIADKQHPTPVPQPIPKVRTQPTEPATNSTAAGPPSNAAQPKAPPRSAASQPNAEQIGENLVTTLQAFGISVSYQGAAIGPAFIRVKLKPDLGVKVSAILKLSNDLRVQLGLPSPPLIAPQAGYVSVDLPRPDRQTAKFDQFVQTQVRSPAAPTHIAIGVNLEGQLVEADLSDPNTCHFLVGGTTGSGKSEFLRSLLLSLLARHSPNHLRIVLVDPKRVTFPEFERMPWLLTPVAKDSERAVKVMEDLVSEMESRYQKFEISRCNNLSSYNQKFIQRPDKLLPRIVCIFDEYADFMVEKDTAKVLELSIKRLGAMARAAGIHLIIATQRPEAKIVTPVIRSNLPGRVALRTASEADSAIVLGGKQTEAAYLLGKGDLLYLAGASLHRLQSLFAAKIELPATHQN